MLLPVWLGGVVLFIAFFVGVPAIACIIAYAAWMGKPKNWDRSMYWTAFIASVVASGFLIVCAQRIQADVRTFAYLVQLSLFGSGVLLLGVASGCMVGIFTYGRGMGPIWREVTPQHRQSTDSDKGVNGPRADN